MNQYAEATGRGTFAVKLKAKPDHDGKTYDRTKDRRRLNKQTQRVFDYMCRHDWVTLRQASDALDIGEASVSARIRDLRKEEFGGFVVDRRAVPGKRGLYEYRLQEPAQ